MTCDRWPVVWPCEEPPGSPDQQDAAISAAQTLLWSRTGRQLGLCTAHDRYTALSAANDCGRPYMTDDRIWHNGGRTGGQCCAIQLWHTPVKSIVEVKLNGQLLDPAGYRLEGNRLVRGGLICWPTSLDCDAAPVEVTYRWGVPLIAPVEADPTADPPVVAVEPSELWGLVAAAMGEVALEVARALCGQDCRLPSNVISATSRGVTVQRQDVQTSIDQRLLGLEIADLLILTVNPARRTQRGRVYSPDTWQRV